METMDPQHCHCHLNSDKPSFWHAESCPKFEVRPAFAKIYGGGYLPSTTGVPVIQDPP